MKKRIIIPMAGAGSRFANEDYQLPKPLIDVQGLPMYERALSSLPINSEDELIFLCLKEHLENFPLRKDLSTRYLDCTIISVDFLTDGQACTVLLAKNYIDDEVPIIIYNIDTYFESPLGITLAQLDPHIDGLLSVFEANDPKWSFARTNEAGEVVELAEKKAISPWATTGMYYFSRGSDFVKYTEVMIKENLRINNEFYVAPVYNLMIKDGMKISLDYCSKIVAMGTPQDLKNLNHTFTQSHEHALR